VTKKASFHPRSAKKCLSANMGVDKMIIKYIERKSQVNHCMRSQEKADKIPN